MTPATQSILKTSCVEIRCKQRFIKIYYVILCIFRVCCILATFLQIRLCYLQGGTLFLTSYIWPYDLI